MKFTDDSVEFKEDDLKQSDIYFLNLDRAELSGFDSVLVLLTHALIY